MWERGGRLRVKTGGPAEATALAGRVLLLMEDHAAVSKNDDPAAGLLFRQLCWIGDAVQSERTMGQPRRNTIDEFHGSIFADPNESGQMQWTK